MQLSSWRWSMQHSNCIDSSWCWRCTAGFSQELLLLFLLVHWRYRAKIFEYLFHRLCTNPVRSTRRHLGIWIARKSIYALCCFTQVFMFIDLLKFFVSWSRFFLVCTSALISLDSCHSLLSWWFDSCLSAFHRQRLKDCYSFYAVVFLKLRRSPLNGSLVSFCFLLVLQMTRALIYFNEPESQDNNTIIQFHFQA